MPEVGTIQAILLVLFFSLFFYRIGAGNLEGLMNYPFWRDMGPLMSQESFKKLRADHLWKIVPLLVAPFIAEIVVTAVVVFVLPAFIPLLTVLAILALQLVGAASTVLIQVPIQIRHNRQGYDRPSFDRLIQTDFWLRKVPSFVQAALTLYVLWLVVAR